jgi:hypothetical protein
MGRCIQNWQGKIITESHKTGKVKLLQYHSIQNWQGKIITVSHKTGKVKSLQ